MPSSFHARMRGWLPLAIVAAFLPQQSLHSQQTAAANAPAYIVNAAPGRFALASCSCLWELAGVRYCGGVAEDTEH